MRKNSAGENFYLFKEELINNLQIKSFKKLEIRKNLNFYPKSLQIRINPPWIFQIRQCE